MENSPQREPQPAAQPGNAVKHGDAAGSSAARDRSVVDGEDHGPNHSAGTRPGAAFTATYDASASRRGRVAATLLVPPALPSAGRDGAKLMFRVVPVALASRARVRVDGSTLPPSQRATTSCFVPMRAASCSWVRPAWARADERGGQGELAFQRLVFLPIGRAFHPARMEITNTGHGSTSLARLSARSLSRLVVQPEFPDRKGNPREWRPRATDAYQDPCIAPCRIRRM